MGRLFDPETPVMQWLQKIATVIFCGFFWVLCCIPVITAGAATTAMYRMMFNLREDKSSRTADYFRVFAREFKKSTILWLIELLCAALSGLCFYLILASEAADTVILVSLLLFVTLFVILLFMFTFVYPLTAYFENTVGATLKNGLLMALAHRHQSIPAMALAMLPVIAAAVSSLISYEMFYYVIISILPVWVFVIIPLLAYVQSGLFLTVFRQYEPEETAPAGTEANTER